MAPTRSFARPSLARPIGYNDGQAIRIRLHSSHFYFSHCLGHLKIVSTIFIKYHNPIWLLCSTLGILQQKIFLSRILSSVGMCSFQISNLACKYFDMPLTCDVSYLLSMSISYSTIRGHCWGPTYRIITYNLGESKCKFHASLFGQLAKWLYRRSNTTTSHPADHSIHNKQNMPTTHVASK